MSPIAVSVAIEQHRSLALVAKLGGARHGVADGQRIHAVDDFGVHVVVGKTGGAARDAAHAHHFVVGAMRHAVMVVDDEENHRHAEFVARPDDW